MGRTRDAPVAREAMTMLHALQSRRLLPPTPWLVVAAIAIVLGAVVPPYVMALDDSIGKLLALPALMLLVLLTAYSRTLLLLMMILIRGSTESLFAESRFAIGSAQIGLGGLLNGFAILIAILLVVEKPELFSKKLLRICGAFLFVCFLGVLNAPERGDAFRLLLQFLSNFAIFVAAYCYVRTVEDFRTCVKLVIWSSVVPALYGLVQFAAGTGYVTDDAGMRINATFSHPNIFAFYLTLVIGLLFYVLKSGKFTLTTARRISLFLYLVLMFGMLILTKTRSAWAACVLMFLVYGILFQRRYLAYLVIGGGIAMFVPGVGDRLIDITQNTHQSITSHDQLNSFAWRVYLWDSAIDYMSPIRYLYGYGLEAFPNTAQKFFPEAGGVDWDAHNVYVQLFFELGAIGIAAFLLMYGRLMAAIKPMFAFDRIGAFTMMFVIVEYLVVCASDNMLHYLSFNWYLWFVYGASIAMVETKSSTRIAPASASASPSNAWSAAVERPR